MRSEYLLYRVFAGSLFIYLISLLFCGMVPNDAASDWASPDLLSAKYVYFSGEFR